MYSILVIFMESDKGMYNHLQHPLFEAAISRLGKGLNFHLLFW